MKNFISLTLCCTFLILSSPSLAQYASGNIHTSARIGDLKTLKTLIKQKPNQTTLDQALHAALIGKQTKTMSYLINQGANVNQKSSLNIPLLNKAIMENYFEEAHVLIKNNADVHARHYKTIHKKIFVDWNWTPLMCAARKGNMSLIKNLIKHGADVKAIGWSQSTKEEETSADIAAYSNHLPILKFLHKKGSPIHIKTLFKTTRAGHLDILKYLIKISPQSHTNERQGYQNRTLFLEAVWWGHLKIVTFLLEQKSINIEQTDKNGLGAMDYALNHKNPSLVRLLKKHNIYMSNKNTFKMKKLLHKKN